MFIRKYGVQLVQEQSKRYMSTCITSSGKTKEIIKTMFDYTTWHNERFGCICLDAQNRPIGVHIVSIGTVNETLVMTREIAVRALLNNAVSIILFHNHPSGTMSPSKADKEVTAKIKAAMQLININVLDHVILTDTEVVSMAEGGYL